MEFRGGCRGEETAVIGAMNTPLLNATTLSAKFIENQLCQYGWKYCFEVDVERCGTMRACLQEVPIETYKHIRRNKNGWLQEKMQLHL